MANDFTDYLGSDVQGKAGLELEWRLLTSDGQLAPRAAELLQLMALELDYSELAEVATPEYGASMLETKTVDGGTMPAALPDFFRRQSQLLIELARSLDVRISTVPHYSGTDEMWQQQPVFADPGGPWKEAGLRYAEIRRRLPLLQANPRIANGLALQPHAGLLMGTERQLEAAVATNDILSSLVSALAALAASSPSPHDPYIDSERQLHWSKLPRSGVQLFGSFANLLAHGQQLKSQGDIKKNTEMWYGVRLQAHGIELRILDMQLTLDRILGLTAFTHCLVMAVNHYVQSGNPVHLPDLDDLNSIELARMSLQQPHQVPFWDFTSGHWSTLAHKLEWLLTFARGGIGQSGQKPFFDQFAERVLVRNNGAAVMRQLFAEHSTPQDAYLAAADLFEASVLEPAVAGA
jgi:gamma-glutamyl:cysteine ligase YbdK (ATP-grasp superfamily)